MIQPSNLKLNVTISKSSNKILVEVLNAKVAARYFLEADVRPACKSRPLAARYDSNARLVERFLKNGLIK